jgi:hypothetical protein
MGNKLYVGNLPYSFRDEDLQQAFAALRFRFQRQSHDGT